MAALAEDAQQAVVVGQPRPLDATTRQLRGRRHEAHNGARACHNTHLFLPGTHTAQQSRDCVFSQNFTYASVLRLADLPHSPLLRWLPLHSVQLVPRAPLLEPYPQFPLCHDATPSPAEAPSGLPGHAGAAAAAVQWRIRPAAATDIPQAVITAVTSCTDVYSVTLNCTLGADIGIHTTGTGAFLTSGSSLYLYAVLTSAVLLPSRCPSSPPSPAARGAEQPLAAALPTPLY